MATLDEYLRSDPGTTGDVLGRWIRGFAQFGKPACVRAAIGAARTALVAFERAEPGLRGPHERIAAAEAWLACQCAAHVDAGSKLAWANGDDNPLKWTRLVVDGKSVEDMNAIYAHWSSDNAANTLWLDDLGLLAQVIETASGAALGGLEVIEPVLEARVRRVHAGILAEFASDPTERGFLTALARGDDATRVVYADWLEERRRIDEATRLRG